MKFLKSLSKFIILGFGSISLCTTLGLGIAGKVYEKQAIEFYKKVRDELNKEDNKSIFSQIKNAIEEIRNFDVTKTIDDLKLKFVEVKNFLGVDNNGNSTNIGTLISQLESISKAIEENKGLVDKLPKEVVGNTSREIKQKLDQSINDLKNIQTNTNSIITQIDTNLTNFEGPIKEYLDKDSNLLRQIDQYTDQINNLYSSVSNWMQNTNPNDVEKYYGLTTTLLIAIPASIIGIGLLGLFSGWIQYRNIDGKLYSRNNIKAEKEALNHIKKLENKFPKLKNRK